MTDAPDLARLAAESGWVRALARHLVRDAHLADDLAQDALVAALEHRGPIESLRAFVATALRRRVSEGRREAAARVERERRTARGEALPSTLAMVACASSQRDLVQAVLELEEPYRTAILWRFFEELPPRAIARRAGVPVATVHTRLQRGLARLRARLAREHGGETWVVALLPLTRLPRGAARFGTALIGALLVQTSTKLVLATLLLAGGATVAWRWLADGERAHALADDSPAVAAAPRERVPVVAPFETRPAQRELGPTASAPAATPEPVAPTIEVASTRLLRGLALDDLGRALAGVALATRPGGERFTSAADGSFALRLAAPAQSIVSDDARFATVLAGAAGTTADSGAIVVLAPRLQLAGHAFGAGGSALAGVELQVELPRDFGSDFGLPLDGALTLSWSAVSAADGAFRLADVPAVSGARLSAHHGGYEPFASALPRVSDEDLRLELVPLRAAEELVRGRVLLPDGLAAAEARVAFGLSTTVCDADGRFELAADEGAHPDVVRAVRRGLAPAQATRAEHGGVWPRELVLRLGATSASITGRVLGPDGAPLSGARVWLADPTWFGGVEGDVVATENLVAPGSEPALERRFWGFVETQGDGSFALEGLLERAYRLRALDPRTLLWVESEPVAAGARGVELHLPADALFARVRGRVVDGAGQGIAGVAVVLERMALVFEFPGGGTRDEFVPRPAETTDAEGRFELADVPREGVELFASGDPILFASLALHADTDPEHVELRAERRIHLQVELDPPLTRADALRVLDGDGQGVLLRVMRGSTSQTSPQAPIENGRSQVLSLSERARTVVLFAGGVEVARLSLRPSAEGVNLVGW